jgi:hypothetical protein
VSIENNDESLTVQQIRERIEDYQTTIHAILCFISVVVWDDSTNALQDGSKYSIGRKMDASPENRISPSETLTPDIVIQKVSNLGYVVEAKKSLPEKNNHWKNTVDQLVKYDDNLLGWWSSDGKLDTHCIILLLEISRSADFKDYLEEKIDSGDLEFVRPFSLIEFTRSPEAQQYLFVRKLFGDIEDGLVSAKLHSGCKVPIEGVLATFGEMKFYDTHPPLEHTMVILWQNIFTDLKTSVDYDDSLRAWPLLVNADSLTEELQKLYGKQSNGHREVSFPRKSWIKQALDAFVQINLAARSTNDGHYVISFKLLRGDLIERFSKNRAMQKKAISAEDAQLKFL